MSRPLRIEFDGAVYHVLARGNAREPIFFDDQDRQAFLEGLLETRDTHDSPDREKPRTPMIPNNT